MSAFLAVSSDICFNCSSEAYKPGTSKTTHNSGLQWQLAYPNQNITLGVIEFTDEVWLDNTKFI